MNDIPYKVVYLDLPCSVRGFVLKKYDFYTIVLNSRLNYEQNKKTLLHELEHIYNDDFNSGIDINSLENKRHESGSNIELSLVN